MALSGLELGLAIALGIVCLVLTVILMYYFVVYKASKRLNANTTEIFTAFKDLKDIKKQISVAKDVEIYLREADEEMRKNQAEISSLVDEKTEKTVNTQFYGDKMLN